MSCSDIISIIDIAVSAGVGIWVATAIAKGQTKERFLKEYFTHELISIKEECKVFFDDICYDQKSANEIKTGFKILSMRAKAFEDNLREAFKNSGTCIHSCITKIQIEITNSDEFNEQFKQEKIRFGAIQKARFFEQRSLLLSAFSSSVIDINKASVKLKGGKIKS